MMTTAEWFHSICKKTIVRCAVRYTPLDEMLENFTKLMIVVLRLKKTGTDFAFISTWNLAVYHRTYSTISVIWICNLVDMNVLNLICSRTVYFVTAVTLLYWVHRSSRAIHNRVFGSALSNCGVPKCTLAFGQLTCVPSAVLWYTRKRAVWKYDRSTYGDCCSPARNWQIAIVWEMEDFYSGGTDGVGIRAGQVAKNLFGAAGIAPKASALKCDFL